MGFRRDDGELHFTHGGGGGIPSAIQSRIMHDAQFITGVGDHANGGPGPRPRSKIMHILEP